jgi:hypothetical protein
VRFGSEPDRHPGTVADRTNTGHASWHTERRRDQ